MSEPGPLYAYKITVWCESGRDTHDVAMALEQGELWDVATNVQYRIEDCTERAPAGAGEPQ